MPESEHALTQKQNLSKHQFILGMTALAVFLILSVILYITFRSRMEAIDWVAFYVLIGFVGGLIFYLVDPLRDQSFKWKGVANIGGAAAVGAGFMWLASSLPSSGGASNVEMGSLFEPPPTVWLPINRSTGEIEEVEVEPLGDHIPLPDSSAFNWNLTLRKAPDRPGEYQIVNQNNSDFQLGSLEIPDFQRSKLIHNIRLEINELDIREAGDGDEISGAYPFSILAYKEGGTLRFRLKTTRDDSILVDRAANKELNRVLQIEGKTYAIIVVLSVKEDLETGKEPFAEFAILELKPTWRAEHD